MMIGTVIVGLVLVALVAWILESKDSLIRKIPGPATLPLLGNAHMLSPNAYEFYNQVLSYCNEYKKHGLFRLFLGSRPMVVLFAPGTAEVVLNSSKHITKSRDYIFLHPWLSTGLLTSAGEKWRRRRRFLTPTFHFRILQDFQHVFNEQSSILVNKLKKKLDTGPFDIFPYITHCALDIICDTAMGVTVNAQKYSESEYVKAVYKISELIHKRQKAPWLWPEVIYSLLPVGREHEHCLNVLHSFTKKVIEERKIEIEDKLAGKESEDENTADLALGRKKRLAFLDMLIYSSLNDAHLTSEDIREEVDTFMFEGHDTTAAAASWALYLIGSHPNVQKRLHEEMDAIFGNDDRNASTEDIKDMKYLASVVKEALRLFPSVPMFGREFTEDSKVGGYIIPKGTGVVIVTSMIHRCEQYFPDPEKFNPDRFTPENSSGMHPYAFIPFSAGMRNCIGQKFALNEEKVLLSSILRNFHIEAKQKREDLQPMGELILRPANGIWVKLSARKDL